MMLSDMPAHRLKRLKEIAEIEEVLKANGVLEDPVIADTTIDEITDDVVVVLGVEPEVKPVKKAGRPSVLTDEMFFKIRGLVVDGVGLKDIQSLCEIPNGTWERWYYTNYEGFRDKIDMYRHERMLKKAEYNIERNMSSDDDKLRLNASKFVAETLGKKKYSKLQQHSGEDGGAIVIEVADYDKLKNTDTAKLQSEGLPVGVSESSQEVQDSGMES